MTVRTMVEKQKVGRIDFIDVGFDDAVRLKSMSSRPSGPRRVFIGVEAPRSEGEFASDAPNLVLSWGGVLHELGKLPDGSVNVVNADFSLFSGFSAVDMPSRFTISEGMAVVAGGDPAKVKEFFIEEKAKVLQQIRRVLQPHGRLYITEYAKTLEETERHLNEAGFAYSLRKMRLDELDKTNTMRLLRKDLEEGRFKVEEMQPYRMVATKRPTEPA
jgi:hypothetical protein